MNELAIYLNALFIYGRLCHNLASGISFLSDHDFFAEIYEFGEDSYDSVIERCIGLGLAIDIKDINLRAAKINSKLDIGSTNQDKFNVILGLLNNINLNITKLVQSKDYTIGTEQLIGDIANKVESFQYKIKQRINVL